MDNISGREFVIYDSEEEEYVDSSDDDEDFIIPAHFIRVTTTSEIKSHEVIPSCNSHEEIEVDVHLMSRHTYLGPHMVPVPSTAPFENAITQIIVLTQPNIITFPGHTLPLSLLYPPLIEKMKSVIYDGKVFGFIPSSIINESMPASFLPYGTIAEITEYNLQTTPRSILHLTSKVKQRCKILKLWRDCNNLIMAQVQILSEMLPQDFNAMIDPRVLDKRKRASKEVVRKNDWKSCQKWIDSGASPFPSWVLQQFDCQSLAARLKCDIQMLIDIESENCNLLPTEPVNLSFWAARNLPLEDEERLELLQYDNTVYRLRKLLELVHRYTTFVCCECSLSVCRCNGMEFISSNGPCGLYVDPEGNIIEIITFKTATNVRVVTKPSIYYSWFPGYAWAAAECSSCKNHLGWLFISATEKCMKPMKFWVFCRRSLKRAAGTID